jgi:uncharacterized protein YlzI (FlbEa/FlbD family)
MFIKLTRKDGTPIYLNAGFIVTVEPARGGSIVVPVGDGLDYEVRDTPERVLAMLDGAPEPVVVPVPTSDALTPTPEDVSPEELPHEPAAVPAAEEEPSAAADAPPAKRTRAKAKEPAAAKKTAKPARTRTRKPALELTDEEVERLKKMAPKSLKKLVNTLVAQFKVTDAEAAVQALAARKIVSIDQERVTWDEPSAADPLALPVAPVAPDGGEMPW